jgi:hypothetical protein
MAVTTVDVAGGGGLYDDKTALEEHLTKYAEPNKLNNYEAYQWCTEALLADNSGLTIIIPTITDTSQATPATAGEGVPIATERAMTFGNRTVVLEEFEDAYTFSSAFRKSVSMRGWLERHALFLANGFARRCEDQVIAILDDEGQAGADVFHRADNSDNGGTMWCPPDVVPGTTPTAYGVVADGDLINAGAYMKARSLLRSANAYGYAEANGKFAAFIDPDTLYSLQTNLVNVGSTPIPTFERDSMSLTDVYKTNMIADMWGFRFFESPYTCFSLASGELGLASGSTGNLSFCLAPDALYRGAFSTDNFQMIFHDVGEAGAADPTDQKGSLGAKGYCKVAAGDTENGIVKIPVPVQNAT